MEIEPIARVYTDFLGKFGVPRQSGRVASSRGKIVFLPPFRRVEALRQGGEFHDLKGLLYFTDGRGIFPEQRPDYDTAFVFVDDGSVPPEVPAWAIRLVLDADELEAEGEHGG